MGGPIRAGCLGEEAEKTGKGTGRERIWHSAHRQRNCSSSPLTWPACLILERFCPNGDSLKLSPRLWRGGFLFQSRLVGLTDEDIAGLLRAKEGGDGGPTHGCGPVAGRRGWRATRPPNCHTDLHCPDVRPCSCTTC